MIVREAYYTSSMTTLVIEAIRFSGPQRQKTVKLRALPQTCGRTHNPGRKVNKLRKLNPVAGDSEVGGGTSPCVGSQTIYVTRRSQWPAFSIEKT